MRKFPGRQLQTIKMKASSFMLQNLLRLFLRLLLIITVTQLWAVSGNSMITYEGVVGGHVTFFCPVDTNMEIDFLYLQTKINDEISFINGYHARYSSSSAKFDSEKWPNTEINRTSSAVSMYNLNISNNGAYECVIGYKTLSDAKTHHLHLTVTAPYSKPVAEYECSEENGVLGCLVTCVSHDGFPKKKMEWNVASATNGKYPAWVQGNNSVKDNSSTSLYSIYSTAYFNCTSGEQRFNCSVDNTVSDNISICVIQEPLITITAVGAICSVLVVFVGIFVVLCMKCKKKCPPSCDGIRTDNNRGQNEEIVELNIKNEINS